MQSGRRCIPTASSGSATPMASRNWRCSRAVPLPVKKVYLAGEGATRAWYLERPRVLSVRQEARGARILAREGSLGWLGSHRRAPMEEHQEVQGGFRTSGPPRRRSTTSPRGGLRTPVRAAATCWFSPAMTTETQIAKRPSSAETLVHGKPIPTCRSQAASPYKPLKRGDWLSSASTRPSEYTAPRPRRDSPTSATTSLT